VSSSVLIAAGHGLE